MNKVEVIGRVADLVARKIEEGKHLSLNVSDTCMYVTFFDGNDGIVGNPSAFWSVDFEEDYKILLDKLEKF